VYALPVSMCVLCAHACARSYVRVYKCVCTRVCLCSVAYRGFVRSEWAAHAASWARLACRRVTVQLQGPTSRPVLSLKAGLAGRTCPAGGRGGFVRAMVAVLAGDVVAVRRARRLPHGRHLLLSRRTLEVAAWLAVKQTRPGANVSAILVGVQRASDTGARVISCVARVNMVQLQATAARAPLACWTTGTILAVERALGEAVSIV
jgi:hypothetical protein